MPRACRGDVVVERNPVQIEFTVVDRFAFEVNPVKVCPVIGLVGTLDADRKWLVPEHIEIKCLAGTMQRHPVECPSRVGPFER